MSGASTVAARYRLVRELGRGGMGVVWQAYDELLHRDVAMKEVHFPPGLTSEESARLSARTLREARAVAAVDTPAAVRVFDIVEQDDRPWIVMELVRGHTLTEVVRERGPLPAREVARVGLAVLEALETAHAAGVLHRDVKPSNVLIGDDGRVALTDFGIATMDGDATDTTTSGLLVGSPAYIAPERMHGQQPTAASDLWGLGATLWTALEGRPPYEGANAMAVMTAVANGGLPRITRSQGPLAEVLPRLLRRDPASRPNAAELRAVLQRSLDETATQALPDPYPTERLPVAFDRTTVLERPVVPAALVSPAPPRPPVRAPQRVAPSRRPPRRSPVAPFVGLVLVLLLLGLGAFFVLRPGANGASTTGARATKAPRATTSAGAPSGSGHSAPPAVGGGKLPDGWTRYTDPQVGWSIGVPAGWTRSQTAAGTMFSDPGSSRYFLVGTRYPAGDSAVGTWRDLEKDFRKRHDGYQRLRLETISADGANDAADWEFTYASKGATLHALDRALVFGRRGFAIYTQAHDDDWSAAQDVFDQLQPTFHPAGTS